MKNILLISTALLVSACSTPQPRQIPLPQCNQPIPVDAQIWNDLELMRDTLSHNSLVYQECIERYKQRIEAFNETSD